MKMSTVETLHTVWKWAMLRLRIQFGNGHCLDSAYSMAMGTVVTPAYSMAMGTVETKHTVWKMVAFETQNTIWQWAL